MPLTCGGRAATISRLQEPAISVGWSSEFADTQTPPSSSGLGYQVLILETGVRLPLGVFVGFPALPDAFGSSRVGALLSEYQFSADCVTFPGLGVYLYKSQI